MQPSGPTSCATLPGRSTGSTGWQIIRPRGGSLVRPQPVTAITMPAAAPSPRSLLQARPATASMRVHGPAVARSSPAPTTAPTLARTPARTSPRASREEATAGATLRPAIVTTTQAAAPFPRSPPLGLLATALTRERGHVEAVSPLAAPPVPLCAPTQTSPMPAARWAAGTAADTSCGVWCTTKAINEYLLIGYCTFLYMIV